MTLRVAQFEGSAEQWDAAAGGPGAMYRTHAFGEVLREGLGQNIVRIGVFRGSELEAGTSVALLRSRLFGRFGVSLPVSDHSGAFSVSDTATEQLQSGLMDLRQRHGLEYVQLRHDHQGGSSWPAADHKVTMRLDLPAAEDELWSTLKAKVRNLARKGEKAELVYHQGGMERLDAFYSVYRRNLRDLGTPCYPRGLFEAWGRAFADSTRIHTATLAGKVVAVGFTSGWQGRQQIPFAASLQEHRNISPNMFLYWKMLASSIESGYQQFDFGRSTKDAGTYRFKKQWGSQECPLHWHQGTASNEPIDDSARVDNPRYQLAMRMWQRLPVPVATFLGTRLVRHLP